MSAEQRRDRLVELIEPVAAESGLDLEDVTVTPAGKRRLVRVVVDRDGGVTLDDTSELSRALSEVLDASDAMGPGPYTLEVTSPGVDRPLTEERHWRRATGRLVRVPLHAGGEIVGRVVSADSGGVSLDVDGTPRAFGYDELGRGQVQVEFRRGDSEGRAGERPQGAGGSSTTSPARGSPSKGAGKGAKRRARPAGSGRSEEGQRWTST